MNTKGCLGLKDSNQPNVPLPLHDGTSSPSSRSSAPIASTERPETNNRDFPLRIDASRRDDNPSASDVGGLASPATGVSSKGKSSSGRGSLRWADLEQQATLGHGRFGKVYSVKNKLTGEFFALKCIGSGAAAQAEIRALKLLTRQPAILKLYKVFQSKRHVYLLTEVCKHGDLFDWIYKYGPLSEYSAQDVAVQLSQALMTMHAHGIVHRDVKLENVLVADSATVPCVSPAGITVSTCFLTVRLGDFGLATALDDEKEKDSSAGQPTGMAGTASYLPPEAKNGIISLALDMWSLGVSLYICLAGYHPFDEFGDSPVERFEARIAAGDFSFKDKIWSTVSDDAKHFITQLLQTDAEKRMSASECLAHPWVQEVVTECGAQELEDDSDSGAPQ